MGSPWVMSPGAATAKVNSLLGRSLARRVNSLFLGALCPSESGLMNKHIVKHIVNEVKCSEARVRIKCLKYKSYVHEAGVVVRQEQSLLSLRHPSCVSFPPLEFLLSLVLPAPIERVLSLLRLVLTKRYLVFLAARIHFLQDYATSRPSARNSGPGGWLTCDPVLVWLVRSLVDGKFVYLRLAYSMPFGIVPYAWISKCEVFRSVWGFSHLFFAIGDW